MTNFAQANGIDTRGDIFVSRFATVTTPLGKRIPVTG